jgi:hypothetical protein
MNVMTLEEFAEKLTGLLDTDDHPSLDHAEKAMDIASALYANGFVMIRGSLEGKFATELVAS